MKTTRLPDLLAALFLSLAMLATSCLNLEAASDASAPANEPGKAKPFEGQIFRTPDDSQAITLVSPDELEMRGGDAGPDNLICKYTRQDDTLRVVKTMLGTTLAVYYKITPDGLQAKDGTVLFNPAKFLFVATARLNLSGTRKEREGDYDGAIADYNRAIEINPKDTSAYRYRASAKRHKGDLDGEMADYNRAIEINPKDQWAYERRASAKERKGDPDGAMADYNRAIEIDPKQDSLYHSRGFAKESRGDLDGAIADYNRYVELDPKNVFAYAARGKAKSSKGDQDGAIADFNRILELKPESTWAYSGRGKAYMEKGDYERAIQDCSRGIEANEKEGLLASEWVILNGKVALEALFTG